MHIDLAFLLAKDVPVTEENIKLFRTEGLGRVINNYQDMKVRLQIYEEIFSKLGMRPHTLTSN